MKLRAIALACMSLALPGGAHAADDFCSRLIVQALSQICRYLPNGTNVCQPVAVVGNTPECTTPQQPSLVPFGPASVQPATPWSAPYATAPAPAPAPKPATAAAVAPFATTVTAPAAPSRADAMAVKPAAVLPAAAATVAAEKAPVATLAAAAPIPAAPSRTDSVTVKPAAVLPTAAATVVAGKAPVATLAAAAPSRADAVAVKPAALAAETAPPLFSRSITTALPISPLPAATDAAWPEDTAARASEAAGVDALAHFAFDSADLTPAGRAVLDAWLAEASANKSVRVSGHADRLGPAPYNLKLSLRRAQSVKQYLVAKGIAARRVQLEAKGKTEPVKRCKGGATPTTKACLAPNRRVQVEME